MMQTTSKRRLTSLAAGGGALALATVLLTQTTATAAPAGLAERIVYTHWTPANAIEDIASIRPVGTGETYLTSSPAVSDRDPAWNAAGTKIAFHRSDGAGTISGIWTMNADGTGLAMVPNTDDGFSAAWSPGGDQLAFVCPAPGDTEICTINVDGTGLTQLTSTSDSESAPAWSPDGSEIAFGRTPVAGDRQHLVAVDPATLSERTITPSVAGQHDGSPDWRPDGSKLTFSRFVTGSRAGGAIYVVDADGSTPGLVAAPAAGSDTHYITPAWSPGGKRIAFAHVDDDLAFGHIYTVRPNGSDLHQVTSGARTDLDPS
jgi:TolB protein